ncbi:MAG: nicotinate phosphoribosyltransferase [Actinobacteria bacterium]|nr:nicotinate phosphoribosyltransferase [Actinomycetota bacterium]
MVAWHDADKIAKRIPENLTLLTDLYQITMAQGYWETGKADTRACFYLFFRDNPFDGGYSIACGIDGAIELIENFKFSDSDIEYLASLPAPGGGALFKSAFLEYLKSLELTVDVEAVLEGELVFPREPLVRVIGPIIECQLLETALLNCINFQTLVATKAARVCSVAGGPVAEFGLRRAQGPNGGVSASRAAFIGGCASTSNVLAGKRYNIPVSGTHAHSWVMAFETELEAFRAYAQVSPTNCVLLIDTYNVIEGTRNAIIVGHEMEERGEHLTGVRIDSGDLAWLSKAARGMLDEAGLESVKIYASNDLDERTIESLKTQGAPIDSWGVGTRLATAFDQAALGGVYKLSAIHDEETGEWIPRIKVTEQAAKATIPGVLDVRRYVREDGSLAGDMIYDVNFPVQEEQVIIDPVDATRRKKLGSYRYTQLLSPLVRSGQVVRESEPIAYARDRAAKNVAGLDPSIKRLLRPHTYPVGLESDLFERRDELLLKMRGI